MTAIDLACDTSAGKRGPSFGQAPGDGRHFDLLQVIRTNRG
jgi:hypothetical protein